MEEYIGALAGSVDVVYDGGGKSRGEDRIEQGKDVDVVAKNRAQLLGMIYIETDRRLLSPSLASEAGDTPAYPRRYTHPLAELSYLRHLIEAESSTTITTSTSPPTPRLLGLVPWAPIDEGPAALETYMKLAREVTGEATWARIVGWRFLVQGLRSEGPFGDVMGSEEWIEGLRWLGVEGRTWRGSNVRGRDWEEKRRGFTFDVGVDQHGAGTWQLEGFAECIERVKALEDEDAKEYGDKMARTVFVLSKSSYLALFPLFHYLGNASFAMARSSQMPAILGHILSARQV